MISNSVKYQCRQRGAALVVSLVLMSVAMLLSLSSIQSSRLEETMAGNQRASERALRAAEFGASEIAIAIKQAGPKDNPLTGVAEIIFCEAADDAACAGKIPAVGDAGDPVEVESGLYYRIRREGAEGYTTKWVSEGLVVSGDSFNVDSIVAERKIAFNLRLDGLGKMSAQNPVCAANYWKPATAATIDGESEVDGKYRPAVSAGSREAAREVVAGILKMDSSDVDVNYNESNKNKVKVLFVSNDGKVYRDELPPDDSVDGVYHAKEAVKDDGSIIYDDSCGNSNALCSFKGGISSAHGASILGNPEAFHNFIAAVFEGGDNVNFTSFSEQEFLDGKINIYTDRKHYFVSDDVDLAGDDPVVNAPIFFDGTELASGAASTVDQSAYYSGNVYSVTDLEGGYTSDDAQSFGGGFDSEFEFDKKLIGYGDLPVDDASYAVSEPTSSVDGLFKYFPTAAGYYEVDTDVTACSPVDLSCIAGGDSDDREYKLSKASDGGLVYNDGVQRDSLGEVIYELDSNGDVVLDEYGNFIPWGISRSSLDVWENWMDSDDKITGIFDKENYSGKTGMLIIDGHAKFKGDPKFTGVIIVLGDFKISGGGKDNFLGSVIASPYFFDPMADDGKGEFRCQKVNFDANGGGNHDYIYDQVAVDNALELLPEKAWEAWIVGNNADPHYYVLEDWHEVIEN